MGEQVLKDSTPYLDMLSSYDYTAQNSLIPPLLASLPLTRPISSRFTIRPMTHHDISQAAHLVAHAFGDNGVLFRPVVTPDIYKNINNWIARLRICLCDHCCFVVEDNEFQGDPEMDNCTCQQHTTENLSPKDKKPIVAMIIAYDFASRFATFKATPPAYRLRSIRGILNAMGDKRIERIREEENKMLTKAEVARRAQEAKEKSENPTPDEIHPINKHHLDFKRDPNADSVRTLPLSGEGLEVWLLATRASHAGHGLAAALSNLLVAYTKKHTSYQFISLEAVHPATERIWTSPSIGGSVLARMKTQDYEFQDEDGSIILPFASVKYDVCSIDVILKR